MVAKDELQRYLRELLEKQPLETPIFELLEIAIATGIGIGVRKSAYAVNNGHGIPTDYYDKKALYEAYPNSYPQVESELSLIANYLNEQADHMGEGL